MPKTKAETVTKIEGGWEYVQRQVAGGGENKEKVTIEYRRPTFSVFQEYAMSDTQVNISDFYPNRDEDAEEDEDEDVPETETNAQFLHRMFCIQVDRKAAQDAYKSVAAQSTEISSGDGEKVDVMKFPLVRLIRSINNMRNAVQDRILPGKESDPKAIREAEKALRVGPWKNAGKLLVAQGKAKENETTGLLEAVAA